MVSYHHVQYQKNLIIQSQEILVTDRRTDKSDFIGRCSTNVECPTKKGKKKTKNDENRRISWLENFVSTMQMDYITFGGKN